MAPIPQVLRDVLFLIPVGGLAVIVGIFVNTTRVYPLPLRAQPPDERLAGVFVQFGLVPLEEERIRALDPTGMTAAVKDGDSTIVDARERDFYEIGHIPGALSLPRRSFRAAFPGFQATTDRGRRLVVYCSDLECPDSTVVARALARLGYTEVSVFPGGWAEWTAEGLPEEL